MVDKKVDLIVAGATPAALAAKRATATIPIVMTTSSFLDKLGLVDSLARPGGNVAGFCHVAPETNGTRLELLKEVAPAITGVAVFWSPGKFTAREPKVRRGATAGRRGASGAKPLVSIEGLAPGLSPDEIIGAEVRSSDYNIIGEVKNVVFGAKDGRDYAIVASGGFFTPGKDSIVVPIKSLKVSKERDTFFVLIKSTEVK